jgi:hypothetical protein
MTKKYNGVNPVNEKSLYDLYQRAQDKIEYIKTDGTAELPTPTN